MIEVKHLSKRYPSNKEDTLHDVSFTLGDTGLVYLIGKSGAGKSTLLHILGKMDDEYEGSVRVDGEELREIKEEAHYRFETVGFVFQSMKAEEKESVHDNLLRALAITDLTRKEKEERIDERLEEVGLSDKKKSLFRDLSGGEKKRISLVRALLRDSPILLCDEPLSSLNHELRVKITSILEKEAKKRLVFIITHEKEEIPEEAEVFELRDGKVMLSKEGKESKGRKLSTSYGRKKFSGYSFYHQLFHLLLSKRDLLLVTLMALMIGLFSISFSFQLSGGVSSAMVESMSSYMEENTMVVTPKEEGMTRSTFESGDVATLEKLRSHHPEVILGVSTFYLDSFNNIFGNQQNIKALLHWNYITLPTYSLDTFLQYRMIEETEYPIYGEISDNEDEIILGGDENTISGLYQLVFSYEPENFKEETLEKLGKQLASNPVSLEVKANKAEWGYEQDYSFKITGIALTKESIILHSSESFATHFVSDVMHFKEVLSEETIPEKQPWTLHKIEGLRLHRDHIGDFLPLFLSDEAAMDYTLMPLKSENYYDERDPKTHNHVALLKDCLPKVQRREMESFAKEHWKDVSSITYSSPVYTFTANGYISGFSKPFFFSKYKEKLNEIEDNASKSKENLGNFQGSLIQVDDTVLKADLLSSMDEKGLAFVPLSASSPSPIYGHKPNSMREIGISEGMAIALFGTSYSAVGETINTLVLTETEQVGDEFYNHFASGVLTISGIYKEKKRKIYQDCLFPLSYCFECSSLKPEEIRLEQAILTVDLDSHTSEYYLKEIRKENQYVGAFPMLEMVKEIKKTLKQLSDLFLGLSLLSLFSAIGLLTLSLSLILSEERKEIGILLALGYEKKEISEFYLSFSLGIGFVGFLLSMILTLVSENALKSAMVDMFSAYVFKPLPYLISLGTSLGITLAIGFMLSLRIRQMSPIDAFQKAN